MARVVNCDDAMPTPPGNRRTKVYPFIVRLATDQARAEQAIFAIEHRLGVVLLEVRGGASHVLRRDALEALDDLAVNELDCDRFCASLPRNDRTQRRALRQFGVDIAGRTGLAFVLLKPVTCARAQGGRSLAVVVNDDRGLPDDVLRAAIVALFP